MSRTGVPFAGWDQPGEAQSLNEGSGFVHLLAVITAIIFSLPASAENATPNPPGRLVDLGGHKLHVFCSGHGSPTVVVETGLGDFSFDWTLVQTRVAGFTHICTYDRAGYAWSDPGPKPRTFAQINLELHDALQKLGEQVPFLLVGHSYGGPVVRNFAAVYPHDVAGIVLVDSAVEGMRVGVGGKTTIRLGVNVQAREIPLPHEQLNESGKSPAVSVNQSQPPMPLDPFYTKLPAAEQKLHLWAQSLPGVDDAENSQREWSEQYFARWLANPKEASLGKLPLIVLTRLEGGYGEDLDVPAAQMEQERKDGQEKLAQISSSSEQIFVNSGHNMELEDPVDVTAAIRRIVGVIRRGRPIPHK
jgi:pimeloyl-ACP methyl ester carboxylesterase